MLAEGQRRAAVSLSRMKGLRTRIPGADTRGLKLSLLLPGAVPTFTDKKEICWGGGQT